MPDVALSEGTDAADPDVRRVATLLGGARLLERRLASALDAHKLLLDGLPGRGLNHLVDGLTVLETDASLEPAIGLDRRRPINLLATPVGIALVEDHLGRVRYGACA